MEGQYVWCTIPSMIMVGRMSVLLTWVAGWQVSLTGMARDRYCWSGVQHSCVYQADWVETILPYARSQGAKVFGCAGTCWGGYMVMRLSAYNEFKAGTSEKLLKIATDIPDIHWIFQTFFKRPQK